MDKLLRESGIPYEKVNYYVEPLSKKKLTELLRKMNLKPRDLLRKGEAVYKELGLAQDQFSDGELIELMVKNVPANNGKVGMWGISYPGFYTSAGSIDAHRALKAASRNSIRRLSKCRSMTPP